MKVKNYDIIMKNLLKFQYKNKSSLLECYMNCAGWCFSHRKHQT